MDQDYRINNFRNGEKVWYHHPFTGAVVCTVVAETNLDGGWLILRSDPLVEDDGLIATTISTPSTSVSRRSS